MSDVLTYSQAVTLGIESHIAELLDEALYLDDEPFSSAIAELRDVDAEVDETVAIGDWKALRRSKNGRELVALYRARSQWREDNGHVDGDLVSRTEVAEWGGTVYEPVAEGTLELRVLVNSEGDEVSMVLLDPEVAEKWGTPHVRGTRRVEANRTAQIIRERMHDEEFRYVHRIEDDLEACSVTKTVRREDEATGEEVERDESSFDTWETQDRWAREACDKARADLISALRERNVDPKNPLVKRWVDKRCAAKLGINTNRRTNYWATSDRPPAKWEKAPAYGYCHRTRLKAYRSCIAILRRGYHTGFVYDGGPTPTR